MRDLAYLKPKLREEIHGGFSKNMLLVDPSVQNDKNWFRGLFILFLLLI